jgi:4-amino-4-deoxy-L-arabinose transferase-like glycosyltransferase
MGDLRKAIQPSVLGVLAVAFLVFWLLDGITDALLLTAIVFVALLITFPLVGAVGRRRGSGRS